MDNIRDLVICGIYRSGTTILAEMLSNHPDIFMSSELGTYILKAGIIPNFTGISQKYEQPLNPEIVLNTDNETVEESVNKVLRYLRKKKLI